MPPGTTSLITVSITYQKFPHHWRSKWPLYVSIIYPSFVISQHLLCTSRGRSGTALGRGAGRNRQELNRGDGCEPGPGEESHWRQAGNWGGGFRGVMDPNSIAQLVQDPEQGLACERALRGQRLQFNLSRPPCFWCCFHDNKHSQCIREYYYYFFICIQIGHVMGKTGPKGHRSSQTLCLWKTPGRLVDRLPMSWIEPENQHFETMSSVAQASLKLAA